MFEIDKIDWLMIFIQTLMLIFSDIWNKSNLILNTLGVISWNNKKPQHFNLLVLANVGFRHFDVMYNPLFLPFKVLYFYLTH